MKVKHVILQLEKTLDILRCYETWKIEDMLDDIKTKVSNDKTAQIKPVKKPALEKDIDVPFNDMKNMTREALTTFLKRYKKIDLIKIGSQLGLKLTMNSNKPILIESIANYFSYININQNTDKSKQGRT